MGVTLDSFWSSFGSLLIVFIAGIIYARTQLAKHDSQIKTLFDNQEAMKSQIDKDNTAQNVEIEKLETRLTTTIEKNREEHITRSNEIKTELQSMKLELSNQISNLTTIVIDSIKKA